MCLVLNRGIQLTLYLVLLSNVLNDTETQLCIDQKFFSHYVCVVELNQLSATICQQMW